MINVIDRFQTLPHPLVGTWKTVYPTTPDKHANALTALQCFRFLMFLFCGLEIKRYKTETISQLL